MHGNLHILGDCLSKNLGASWSRDEGRYLCLQSILTGFISIKCHRPLLKHWNRLWRHPLGACVESGWGQQWKGEPRRCLGAGRFRSRVVLHSDLPECLATAWLPAVRSHASRHFSDLQFPVFFSVIHELIQGNSPPSCSPHQL